MLVPCLITHLPCLLIYTNIPDLASGAEDGKVWLGRRQQGGYYPYSEAYHTNQTTWLPYLPSGLPAKSQHCCLQLNRPGRFRYPLSLKESAVRSTEYIVLTF